MENRRIMEENCDFELKHLKPLKGIKAYSGKVETYIDKKNNLPLKVSIIGPSLVAYNFAIIIGAGYGIFKGLEALLK